MKKVRLAIAGAAGMIPAVGLMMPSAANAMPHSAKIAKTVSLRHSVMPAAACTGNDVINAHTQNFHIHVYHQPSTHCVGGINASLTNDCATGFVLRTRAYSISQYGIKNQYINTTTGGQTHNCQILSPPGSIQYYQGIHQIRPAKEQICEAIVFASNHSKIYRGPICVSF